MRTILYLFTFLLFGLTTYSQSSGMLDDTYNNTGVLTLGPGTLHDNINDLAIQADQSVIGFGMKMGTGDYNFDLAITRILPDGTLDTSFGVNGYYTYDHAGQSDFIYQGAVLANGQILACGAVSNTADDTEVMLLRLNADGTLDETFGGGDGMTIETVAAGQDYANSMTILSDGSIVIAGSTAIPDLMTTRGLLMKFSADGILDTTFGLNGHYVYNLHNEYDLLYSIISLPDGSFMAAGSTSANFNTYGWITKMAADGSTDSNFATNGHYEYPTGTSSFVDMMVHGDQIFACGYRYFGTEDVLVVAMDENGVLDDTFGTEGIAIVDVGESDAANEMLIDSEGGLIVVGSAGPDFFARNIMAIRMDLTGALDTSFGVEGVFNYSAATGFDVAMAVVEQADYKLVLGGLASETNNDMLFARINGSATISTPELKVNSSALLFPNPAQTTVTISAPTAIRFVRVFNALGALQFDQTVTTTTANSILDISQWPNGIYTMEITTVDGRNDHQRLIVAH